MRRREHTLIWLAVTAALTACGTTGDGGAIVGGADATPGGDAQASEDDGAVGPDAGAPCDCPAPSPCVTATCDAAGRCQMAPNDDRCDDGSACTDDVCVPGPVCPDGAAPTGAGGCFAAGSASAPEGWAAARARCQADGQDFPIIGDAATNTRIRQTVDAQCGAGEPALLGLRQVGDGRFEWPNGDAPAFAAWSPGEPAAQGEFVVMLGDGRWAVRDAPVPCGLCSAAVQDHACRHDPVDSALSGRVEQCNGLDDDCDGVADEGADSALCDDGNACTNDLCMGADGCVFEDMTALLCDDGVSCTIDTCDPVEGCRNAPDDARCDDGIECTTERCDAVAGCEYAAEDAACDDGVDCTTDRCEIGGGCHHALDDAACDDGVDCTADRCTRGGCEIAPRDAACDDGNPCTDDVCRADLGCDNAPNEAPCVGDVCDLESRCEAGRCVGVTPRVCDDRTPCTADACAPGVGCVAPPEAECADPGPLGGFYEGPFEIIGEEVPIEIAGRVLGRLNWRCWGSLGVKVDASRAVDAYGLGELFCDSSVNGALLTPDGSPIVYPTVISADVMGDRLVGEFTFGQETEAWDAAVDRDVGGLPVRLFGAVEASMAARNFPLPEGLLDRLVDGRFGDAQLPYRMEFELERRPIDGVCCSPAGCEDAWDHTCAARGGDFVAHEGGRCCAGEDCALLTVDECAATGGSYQPTRVGACCLPDATCAELSGALCEVRDGFPVPAASCQDGNGDGLPDVCPAPPDHGYLDAPGCALEGERLTVRAGDAFDLVMLSDWRESGDGYDAGRRVTLVTPLGGIELPDVADLHVGCGARLTMIGHLDAPPGMGGVRTWPSTAVDYDAPQATFGYAYGYELEAQALEGPFASGRPYLFARAETGSSLSLGEGVSIDALDGDSFLLGVDVEDPGFIVEIGGARVQQAAARLVKSVGLGMSLNGNLTWHSAVDLHDGRAPAPAFATGHIWRSGEFALVPYPNLPANVFIDGEVLINVGTAVDFIEPMARALVAEDLAGFRQALAASPNPRALDEVLRQMDFSANVNALSLGVGPVSVTVGSGSAQFVDGRFVFAAESFDFGADEGSPIAAALSAVQIRAAHEAWGYIEGERFHFEFDGDYTAGPFRLDDARVVIDSERGVVIERGEFDLDFAAFLRQLLALMDCQFGRDVDGFTCSVAGIEVANIEGYVDDRGFGLSAGMEVPVLAEVDLSARVSPQGTFLLTGEARVGIVGFAGRSAQVSLGNRHLAISATWDQFVQSVAMSGRVELPGGAFFLRGRGAIEVLGFPIQEVEVQLGSELGLVARGSLRPPAVLGGGTADVVLSIPPGVDQWTLTGDGAFSILGYQLADARLRGSGDDAAAGLSVESEMDVLGTRTQMTGHLRADGDFRLTGGADLGVAGYRLGAARVTFDPSGLQIAGDVDVLGNRIRLSGAAEANGDVRLTTAARVASRLLFFDAELYVVLFKRGAITALHGDVFLDYSGLALVGDFTVDSRGAFAADAEVDVDVVAGPTRANGRVLLRMNNGGYVARFEGQVCAQSNGVSACGQFEAFVPQTRRICVDLPPIGRVCLTL